MASQPRSLSRYRRVHSSVLVRKNDPRPPHPLYISINTTAKMTDFMATLLGIQKPDSWSCPSALIERLRLVENVVTGISKFPSLSLLTIVIHSSRGIFEHTVQISSARFTEGTGPPRIPTDT